MAFANALELGVMVGIRSMTLLAREQLGPDATEEAVAKRYLEIRKRAIESITANPDPSPAEVAATKMIAMEMLDRLLKPPPAPPTAETKH